MKQQQEFLKQRNKFIFLLKTFEKFTNMVNQTKSKVSSNTRKRKIDESDEETSSSAKYKSGQKSNPKGQLVRNPKTVNSKKKCIKPLSPVKIKVVEGRRVFDRSVKLNQQGSAKNKNDNRSLTSSGSATRSRNRSQDRRLVCTCEIETNKAKNIPVCQAEVDGLKLTVNTSEDEEFREDEEIDCDENQSQSSDREEGLISDDDEDNDTDRCPPPMETGTNRQSVDDQPGTSGYVPVSDQPD